MAINTWNGTDLFIPEVMERSLWHVTDGRRTVGHQYWDKIIWVQGAYYHYLLTRDTNFLKEAYICSRNTMKQLETVAYDPRSYNALGNACYVNGDIARALDYLQRAVQAGDEAAARNLFLIKRRIGDGAE